MRILLTGAAGVLGGRLAVLLARRHALVATRHASPVPDGVSSVDLDVVDAGAVERALEAVRPEAVVHAAALVEPDRCEREPERARTLNTDASEGLARACARRGVKLVLVSTDLVFSDADAVRDETATPHPVCVYGHTKRDAEQAVLASGLRHAVARVSLVVGRGHGARGTATEQVAWALRDGRPLWLYTDQWRTPSDDESVAAGCERILERDVAGIFHLCGSERISRYALGRRVAELRGLDPGPIAATTHAQRPPAAPRPLDACLESARTREVLGWEPRLLDQAIHDSRETPDIIPPPS